MELLPLSNRKCWCFPTSATFSSTSMQELGSVGQLRTQKADFFSLFLLGLWLSCNRVVGCNSQQGVGRDAVSPYTCGVVKPSEDGVVNHIHGVTQT